MTGTHRSFLSAIVALAALGPAGCVRVQISYRDVGVDAPERPDTPRPDTPAPDVPLDAPPFDAPRDTPPAMDVPLADTPIETGADATRMVLASIGERVILADLRAFTAAAAALEAALSAAIAAGTPESLAGAQEAWRAAMRIWERVEMFQVGPAGLSGRTAGGLGLRDEIYAWPLVAYCRIDQETVAGTHADAALLRAASIDVRGLSAMEYLLFPPGPGNRCGPTAAINTSGSWAALGDAEVARRRLVYAHTAAVLVGERASELQAAWEPANGNFLGTLRTAGAGSALFGTAQAGLNAVSDALFYLYKDVTDVKVGIPAGLRMECTTATCPDYVESPFADASLDHIRANVEAFRDVYLGAPAGTDAPGFDDLVRSASATAGVALDANIRDAIDDVLAAIDLVLVPLESAVDLDHPDVTALYEALRRLGGYVRVDLMTLLDLEPSNVVEGDAD